MKNILHVAFLLLVLLGRSSSQTQGATQFWVNSQGFPTTPVSATNGGTGTNTSASTGLAQISSGAWSASDTLTRALTLINGTGAAPAIVFTSSTTTGLASTSSNTMGVAVNGTEQARFITGGLKFASSQGLNWGSGNITTTIDTTLDRQGIGILGINNGAVSGTTGSLQLASLQSVGTKFTATGCTNSTTVGGATVGKFTSGTTGTCTVTITFGNSVTSPNGWSCFVNDETTGNLMRETGSNQTTATISGTTVSGDVIDFGCIGY